MERLDAIIHSRKGDGSIRRSWECELVDYSADSLIFVGVFDSEVQHPDLGKIQKGTLSYEYYWLDRWYNIFAFYNPDGGFRNYYCNICMPPVFGDGVLDYVDLEIDIVVWPDWQYSVLDEDEYAENAELYGYSEDVRQNAARALSELLEMVRRRTLPVRH